MGEAIMVGMAEIKFTQSPDDILIALGLGSCISVCAYDPQAGVAGMAHVVLPDSEGQEGPVGKFADTAIPFLLQNLLDLGASASGIRIAIIGGAQLFAFHGKGVRLEVGPRNAHAIKTALEKAALTLVSEDLGGSAGRTVQLTGDGRVRVKVTGRVERELVSLGQPPTSAGVALSYAAAVVMPIGPGIDAIHHAQSPD
jgi:chemotaxis protein CheD